MLHPKKRNALSSSPGVKSQLKSVIPPKWSSERPQGKSKSLTPQEELKSTPASGTGEEIKARVSGIKATQVWKAYCSYNLSMRGEK